jgi:hypothetical protein
LIVAHEVTNVGSDRDQLSSIARQTHEERASDTLSVVADRGWFKSEQILACHDAGITAYWKRVFAQPHIARLAFHSENT